MKACRTGAMGQPLFPSGPVHRPKGATEGRPEGDKGNKILGLKKIHTWIIIGL